MPSLGPSLAGTGTDIAFNSGNSWTNPGNITLNDGSYATAPYNASADTNYLQGTNYNFLIPTGSTITGVVMEIGRKYSGLGPCADVSVKLVKGGVVSGNNKAAAGDWTTSDVIASYGSAVDTWGVTLGSADVNASTFGAVVASQLTTVNGGTANVDFMRMTVYYTGGSQSRRALLGVGK